ncbi:MAG: Holliday junction branch migration protein RuvA [Planctomycetota bacterium]
MYEFLDGRLDAAAPTRVALDVGGIGFDVAVPLGARFGAAPGKESAVRVWTHHVVREDAQRLFGFPTRAEREVFRLLLSVRGVGPGVALAILSALPGALFLEAVAGGDRAALTRVKGVGKKTAEQILLDLAGKAVDAAALGGTLVTHAPKSDDRLEDAVRALTSIGYSEKDARKSVDRAAEQIDPDDLELLVRTALQQ